VVEGMIMTSDSDISPKLRVVLQKIPNQQLLLTDCYAYAVLEVGAGCRYIMFFFYNKVMNNV
jgi:hypothetical protein